MKRSVLMCYSIYMYLSVTIINCYYFNEILVSALVITVSCYPPLHPVSLLPSQYGSIEEMNVCDNLGDHLVGNVYIKARVLHKFLLFALCVL